jgi:hypothetical protein
VGPFAAELVSGNGAPKPSAPRLVDEALRRLPDGHGKVSIRSDSN